jgi:hypothetical protein
MKFLKSLKGKPLKRIELKATFNKFRMRLSRTGGLTGSVHPIKGLTFNTRHGLRVSKTYKGLTLGFQRDNSILRGRWSTKGGLLNLNLAKSGISLSTKSLWGNYNISHPNRSSFKFFGIQIRGKNAAGLAALGSIITWSIYVLKLIPKIIYIGVLLGKFLLLILLWVFKVIYTTLMISYHFTLFLMIDIPKQLYNNIFNTNYFDVGIHESDDSNKLSEERDL